MKTSTETVSDNLPSPLERISTPCVRSMFEISDDWMKGIELPFHEQAWGIPSGVPVNVDIDEGAKNYIDTMFEKLSSGFSDAMESFKEAGSGLKETINSASERMSNIKVGFDWEPLKNILGSVSDQVKTILKTIGDWLYTPAGEFFMKILIGMCVVTALKKYTNFSYVQRVLIITVINIAMPLPAETLTKVAKFSWNKIWDICDCLFPTKGEFHDQVESASDGIKAILTIALGCIFVDNVDYDGLGLDAFYGTCVQFKRVKDGAEVTMEFVFDILSAGLRWVGEKLGNSDLKKFGLKFPRIYSIAVTLRDLVEEIRSGSRKMDWHTNELLKELERELRTLMFSMGHSRLNEPYRREAQMLLDEIKKLAEISGKSGSLSGGPKVEPTCICFVGESRQGKSIGADLFMYETAPLLMSKRRLDAYLIAKNNEVFNVHSDPGFVWTGYYGQFGLKVDDILQLKDSAGAPNPMLYAMINGANSNQWTLDMPDLNSKGAVPFTSSMIVATDNSIKCSHNVIKSLNTPAAFTNRFDMVYLQYASPEFCTEKTAKLPPLERKLDINKMIALIKVVDGVKVLAPEDIKRIWKYLAHDWASGKSISEEEYTYDQVQQAFIAKFKTKQYLGNVLLDMHKIAADQAGVLRKAELKANEERAAALAEDIKRGNLHDQVALGNPWEVLGVSIDADIKEVTKAYRSMALKNHPDRGGSSDKMVEITWAYEVIMDPALNYQAQYCISNAKDVFNNEIVLFKLLTLIRDKDRKPIDPENVIKGFSHMFESLEKGRIHTDYWENILPSEEFVKDFSERVGAPSDNVKMFFLMNNYGEHTPLGDAVTGFYSWMRGMPRRMLKSTIETLGGVLSYIYDIVTNKKVIACAIGIIGAAAIGWKLWNQYAEHHEQTVKMVRPNVKANKITNVPAVSAKPFHDQGYKGDETFKAVRAKVKKNVVFWSNTRDSTKRGYFTFVKGKVAIGVSHAMSTMTEEKMESFWIHGYDGNFLQKINISELKMVYNQDSLNDDDGYFYFKKLNRDFADITHFYCRKGSKEYDLLCLAHHGSLMMPVLGQTVIDGDTRRCFIDTEYVPGYAIPFVGQYGIAKWNVGQGGVYPISTKRGDCGLPWFILDDRVEGCFIGGEHVCGDGAGRGVFLVIDREFLEFVHDYFVENFFEQTAFDIDLPSAWSVIKEVPYERVSSNSKLRRTALWGTYYTSDLSPALLHKKEWKEVIKDAEGIEITKHYVVDPWVNARIPYGINPKRYNKLFLNKLADHYAGFLRKVSKFNDPWEPRVLGKEEACSGFPGIFKGIPRNTSAGYPWSKMSKKKFAFFGRDQNYEFSSKEWAALDEQVNIDLDNLRAGILPEWIYQLFLKDELRKRLKVIAGLTRLVFGSPLTKTIISAMYNKDWLRWIQDNCITNGYAIGLNCYGVHWKIAKMYLQAVSDDMIDGDYKNFDGCQHEELHMASNRVKEDFYFNATEEDRRIREIIARDTANPKTLNTIDGKTYVIEVKGIMPSGDLTTASIGSCNGQLLQRYVRADILLISMGYPGGVDDYDEDVPFDFNELEKDRWLVLGDDHVGSICADHAPIINQKTFGAGCVRAGFNYTDALKTGELIAGHKPLKEVSFCKRGWSTIEQFPGHDFADLDLDVILGMPSWHEKGSPPGTTESTVDMSLIELSAKGLVVYTKYAYEIGVCSRTHINHSSIYAPYNSNPEVVEETWRRCIGAYLKLDLEFGI